LFDHGVAACLDAFAYNDDQLFCYQKFAVAEFHNALEHCRVAAIIGDAEAQFELASFYATGSGVEKDLVSSIVSFGGERLSAWSASSRADVAGGSRCHQNSAEGINFLRKAAVRCDANAQFLLGRVLLDEKPDVGVEWFELSIEQGHTTAMYQYAKHLA
jgi:TPR repeat protein